MRFKITDNVTKEEHIVNGKKIERFKLPKKTVSDEEPLCPKCGKKLCECSCDKEHVDDAPKADEKAEKELSAEEIEIIKQFVPVIPDLLKLSKDEIDILKDFIPSIPEILDKVKFVKEEKIEEESGDEDESEDEDEDGVMLDKPDDNENIDEENSDEEDIDEVDEEEVDEEEESLSDEDVEDEDDVSLEDSAEDIEQLEVLDETDDEEDVSASFDKFYKNQLRK